MPLIVPEYIEPGPYVYLRRVALSLSTNIDNKKAASGGCGNLRWRVAKCSVLLLSLSLLEALVSSYRITKPPWKSWQEAEGVLGFWQFEKVFSVKLETYPTE